MNTVNVIDAPCGYGKTSWAIQYMNHVPVEFYRFIYVTPFLDEVTRVKAAVTDRTFHEPHDTNGKTKLDDLHRLLSEGKDICTTHNLFMKANEETKELIRINNYILILDEVMNVIKQVPLKKDDLNLLKKSGSISIQERQNNIEYIEWNEEANHESRFNDIKRMALAGTLIHYKNSALIWSFPIEYFMVFRDVYILTYLFHGQMQRYYFDLYRVKYKYFSIKSDSGQYELVPYNQRVPLNKIALSNKISIYNGHLNKVGDKKGSLSYTWFSNKKNNKLVKSLSNHAYNYFTNILKTNSKDTIWTTFKGGDKEKIKKKVAFKGFASSFISVNERATNVYKDKFNLAYLANRFMRPIEVGFFNQHKIYVNQDLWAISELIQWIWRSRIRDGGEINIYIPSNRMRQLLEKFLSEDVFETAPKNAVVDQPPDDWHL